MHYKSLSDTQINCQEGAFDNAIQGSDAIFHIASPVHYNAIEPSEVIDSAIAGVTGILTSALKHGQSVKRIVLTSTVGAICTPTLDPHRVFTESDWDDENVRKVHSKGRDALGLEKYQASKVLSERAAWDFWNTHRSEVGWDLTVIAPSFVFGPCLNEVDQPENLGLSAGLWYNVVVRKGRFEDDPYARLRYVRVGRHAVAYIMTLTLGSIPADRLTSTYAILPVLMFLQ